MNREIKFRVWDNVDYMSTPFTLQDIQDKKTQFTSDIILMQFTGLTDKNGIEIYEGDVVVETINTEFGDDKIKHEVTFNAGAFYPLCMQPSDTFEIIGNIYQNPQLLNP